MVQANVIRLVIDSYSAAPLPGSYCVMYIPKKNLTAIGVNLVHCNFPSVSLQQALLMTFTVLASFHTFFLYKSIMISKAILAAVWCASLIILYIKFCMDEFNLTSLCLAFVFFKSVTMWSRRKLRKVLSWHLNNSKNSCNKSEGAKRSLCLKI